MTRSGLWIDLLVPLFPATTECRIQFRKRMSQVYLDAKLGSGFYSLSLFLNLYAK